ncbi:hypothetical protein RI367_005751 [Sorochytrium milnesiophthora]
MGRNSRAPSLLPQTSTSAPEAAALSVVPSSPISASSARATSPARQRPHGGRHSLASVDIFNDDFAIPLRPTVATDDVPPGELPKSIELTQGVSIIVGLMIGSGIFASPGPIYEYTGSSAMSLLIWLLSGLLSTAGALCYVELGTLIPGSGGEYAYLLEAFGPLVASTFTWMSMTLLKTGTSAILATVTAQYIVEVFRAMNSVHSAFDWLFTKVIAVVIVACLAVVNALSTRFSIAMQNALTWLKLVAIALISISGVVVMVRGTGEGPLLAHSTAKDDAAEPTPAPIHMTFTTFVLAMQAGLWGFDGWNNLNYVAGEVKDTRTVLKKSIWIAMPIVTLCYLLTNIAYLAVVPASLMNADQAIAMEFGRRLFGRAGETIIPACVIISTLGALNSSLFTASRIIHSAASQSHLPRFLSKLHPTRHTPVRALALQFGLSVVLIVPSSLLALIHLYSFVAFFFYALTGVALVRLRFTWRYHDRPYKVWPSTVAVFVGVSVFLVVVPITANPTASLVVVAWGLVGVAVYLVRQWWSRRQQSGMYKAHLRRHGYSVQRDQDDDENDDEDDDGAVGEEDEALEMSGLGGFRQSEHRYSRASTHEGGGGSSSNSSRGAARPTDNSNNNNDDDEYLDRTIIFAMPSSDEE